MFPSVSSNVSGFSSDPLTLAVQPLSPCDSRSHGRNDADETTTASASLTSPRANLPRMSTSRSGAATLPVRLSVWALVISC